ncbi:MAG: hypothetical protein JWM82_4199 [Myxococcales bacterium]|nr:hypothetical protein [Myxococcales bacterium]
MRTNLLLSLALLMAAGGALAGCGEEPIPDKVSFARDILPLMEARCIRCHGGGGTLNDDPYSQPTVMVTKPESGDFRHIETVNGIAGLGNYTGAGVLLLKIYIDPMKGPPLMPPLPSPPLTAREKDMLLKWAAGSPPNP